MVAVGIGLVRPGSASAALGNAVVLRMNNMEYLQGGRSADPTTVSAGCTSIYVLTLYAAAQLRAPLGRSSRGSVPRIADQRLAGPEQEHEQNADHTQHGE